MRDVPEQAPPPQAGGVVFSVSTVRDSPANVERFVRGNLAAGVDHMFVFLDGTQPRVRALLDERPGVTAVTTDEAYWGVRVPKNLNVRQTVNANLVNTLLAPFSWATWLFHVDGDETLHLDRERLLGLDAEHRAVRLQPLEAVSRWHWDGEVNLFKQPLDKPTLYLLHQLGVIAEPDNRAYYRGHVIGKTGIRPDVGLDMRVHDAWLPDSSPVPFIRAPWLRLLHYETYSGEEFVRKWGTAPSKTSRVSTRERREQQVAAVRALFALPDVDPAVREEVARELYERSFADDVDRLQRLGLLVRHTSADDRHTPVPLAPEQRGQLEAWLAELLTMDKRYLRPLNDEFPKLEGLRARGPGRAGGHQTLPSVVIGPLPGAGNTARVAARDGAPVGS